MTEKLEIGKAIIDLAIDVLSACRKRGELIATAESCTGGLVAGTLTTIPGASDVFERGFVTYSNASKSELLGRAAAAQRRRSRAARIPLFASSSRALPRRPIPTCPE